MNQVIERRNKNHWKMPIEYDVNVFVRDEYDFETKQSYLNLDNWYLHVYDYRSGNHIEAGTPFLLTKEEAFVMNFEEMGDVDGSYDTWMSLDYLMENYRDQMSDRVLEYLEGFPKYREDIRPKVIYN